MAKIIDDLTGVLLTKQRRYQIRRMRKGLCILCGEKAFESTVWCLAHHRKKGTITPGRNKTRTKKWVSDQSINSLEYHPVFLNG